MPRKRGPRKNKRNGETNSSQTPTQKYQGAQDVSIHEYANAKKPTSRPKKFNTIPAPEIVESWEQLAEEEEEGPAAGAAGAGRRRGADGGEDGARREYPEVVWYLVSRHVRPEDVGRFAGINRATLALTRREGFWRALYGAWCAPRRHLLPPALRARAGGVSHALRQRVVRALHHTYPPFVLKMHTAVPEAQPPHTLVGRRCANLWYDELADCSWRYTIKLKRGGALREEARAADWLQRLSDLDANTERHCRALQVVTCEQFSVLPPAMGLPLRSAALRLAADLHRRCLRLTFADPSGADAALVLDAVRHVAVLDWWHPRYPHPPAHRLPAPPDPADAHTPPLLRRDFPL